MAECIIQKAGGGASSDDCTAGKAQVLSGYTAVTRDSDDEAAAGAMPNRGAPTQSLNCGGSYAIAAGYYSGGRVTANSLAAQTGGATAEDRYVLNGKTYWKDGTKRTGTMTVSSILSFSVAAYSTGQVIAAWQNPAKGPYSGVAICVKKGGYPADINDGRVYLGTGNNSAANGTSTQVIGGLEAGTAYYFRIWPYYRSSAGDKYSGYLQATCTTTAHGRAAYTSSGTWTVPAGVRAVNIHCTGGGGGGFSTTIANIAGGGGGGGGGYTAYRNGINVTPGQQIPITVGAGAPPGDNPAQAGTSSAGSLASAPGGYSGGERGSGVDVLVTITPQKGGNGGSGGGVGNANLRGVDEGPGGSNGGNGAGNKYFSGGTGQNSSTREFGAGAGTLYSGGGGGARNYQVGTSSLGKGGAGGGGDGYYYLHAAKGGAAGTGGGGGGGAGNNQGGAGGSGNVIITW